MPLPSGTRIGSYEIVEPIGSGGMGEVYRARDLRLERDVAIKVLPQSSSGDPTANARLESEARATSALNHPHILTIYEIGQIASSDRFIAMEYIEGETLRARLKEEIPLDTALYLLVQIADGLAKAHGAGIIHRDLKPDNVMINSDGFAKILDFGLARQEPLAIPQPSPDATERMPLTRPGFAVGTLGYMAPEQWSNWPADARSDIFSFGCLAYELITRRRAFEGVPLHDPPPVRTVAPDAPAAVQRIISRCLARNRDERYESMREVMADLRRALERLRHPQARQLTRPVQVTFERAVEQFPAISADGTRVAFSREVGKTRRLFLKSLDQDGQETELTSESFDDLQPSWSPRGDALLFVRGRQPDVRVELTDVYGRYVGGDIWRVDLATLKASLLLSDAANPAWSPDGSRIAFDASWSGQRRVWIADDRGRNPSQVTSGPTESVHHVRPRWSPDGAKIVFQTLEGTKSDLAIVEMETRKMHAVTDDHTLDIHPVWSPGGDAIYFSSYRGGGINIWRIPLDGDGHAAGAMEQVTAGPGHDVDLDMSSAGRLVFAILNQNADLWRLPVDAATGAATGAPEPVIATTRENSRGAWSRDGSAIAFNSDRGGEMNLWLLTLSDGRTRLLTRGLGGDFQPSWFPDGNSVAFFSGRSGALDVWSAEIVSGAIRQLTSDSGININPFVSPDGHSIAFMSDRDGRLEIWLMDADGSRPRQLTTSGVGGHFLRWSADGAHILYNCPSGPRATTMRIAATGGEPVPVARVMGGAHMSLSPDQSLVMDVVAHRTLWVTPLDGSAPRRVFEFEDPESRIDYPVWSPDGGWILFDRFVPRGGDVWTLEV